MGKTKTSRRPRAFASKPQPSRKKRTVEPFKISLRENVGITTFSAAEKLQDIKLIGAAVIQCLIDNDPNGAMEAIETHLEALNKSKFLKKAGVPRSTMYKLLKMKNPTIKTLAKIMHAAYHPEE